MHVHVPKIVLIATANLFFFSVAVRATHARIAIAARHASLQLCAHLVVISMAAMVMVVLVLVVVVIMTYISVSRACRDVACVCVYSCLCVYKVCTRMLK